MHLRIDFTLEDLLGTLHSQRGNLVTQRFTRAHGLLLGFGLGLRDNACSFSLGVLLDLVGAHLGTLFSVRDALRAFIARFGQCLLDPLVGQLQLSLALIGSGQAIVDLVAGRLDLYFVSYAAVVSQVEAGHLRALAVADSARLTALPDLPTAAEAGYPSVSLQSHWGLLAPAGTPDDSVTRLNELFTRALRDPEIRRFMASQGTEAAATTPKEFGDMVASEFISLERILNATGMGKK